MKKRLWVVPVFLLALFWGWAGSGPLQADPEPIAIKILFDNYPFDPGCRTEWGFSCLVSGFEKEILFDTGADANIFLGNVAALNVDLTAVDIHIISHFHGDHIGGLDAFLARKPTVSIYVPADEGAAAQAAIGHMKKAGAEVVAAEQPMEVCPGVFITGTMSTPAVGIEELSLILDTPGGAVIVTGCAHPGIVSILEKAKTVIGKEIDAVLGGFHLMEHSEKDLQAIIARFKESGVRRVGATHCTGDNAIAMFKAAYGENFIPLGAGKSVVFR